ncbi:MAG: GTPase Era [Firmicutes bacterium]|nr:GTPase Era [Bacillota bacterium]
MSHIDKEDTARGRPTYSPEIQETENIGNEFRSGFITLIGRPNVGKSSIINKIMGEKISITSKTPNTTRSPIRAVLDREGKQAIFVDTPGIHKPRSALGVRLNASAYEATTDVDITVLVLDASKEIGKGDQFISHSFAKQNNLIVCLNKIDLVPERVVMSKLQFAHDHLGMEHAEYFAVSAQTGAGIKHFIDYIMDRLPLGPQYFPTGTTSDLDEVIFLAELVREQLLRFVKEELPHSIACRITELRWPYIRCEILVERESQKAMVISKNGHLLKQIGINVRRQLPPGTYLDLIVKVEKNWQKRLDVIERLGY